MHAVRAVRGPSLTAIPKVAARTFAASATRSTRIPSLADVTPGGVAAFDAKQKEFRERLAAQEKAKKESSS